MHALYAVHRHAERRQHAVTAPLVGLAHRIFGSDRSATRRARPSR
ncbi:hypothetical protein [Kitasatospora sp. CB01950]|nr:hypothetical protein [Kitasatospora sp. CB01950]